MQKPEATSAATQRHYDELAGALAVKGVDRSAMFGMPSLKYGGKAFAGVFGDAMVFKLEGDGHAQALALKGARLFDPSGMGRPMKAWVVVPRSSASAWPALAASALDVLSAGPQSTPAKKKKAAPTKAKQR